MEYVLGYLDLVVIRTTKRVVYVSGRDNIVSDPHGLWSVIGHVDGDVLINKDDTIAKIPSEDVELVSESPIQQINKYLNKESE